MLSSAWLWVIVTVIASLGQTARNAIQRSLTRTIGTVGATLVRFLFGLPFGILFLLLLEACTTIPVPASNLPFVLWATLGAFSQVVATALMLIAMNERSFVVATAYIKTEPVLVAIFGLTFLGDALTFQTAAAILIATVGVMMISWTRGAESSSWKPLLFGMGAATLFGISAVSFRGAIRSLDTSSFVMAATFSLAIGLFIQTALLTVYLLVFDRTTLLAILREWRPSLFAGFLGAASSQFWFLGFALTSAANVRTLALIEVLFAQFVTHGIFKEKISLREIAGILLLVGGIALLLWAH